MKSPTQIRALKDVFTFVLGSDQFRMTPEHREAMCAIHNALCYILQDGSPAAKMFRDNLLRLQDQVRNMDKIESDEVIH